MADEREFGIETWEEYEKSIYQDVVSNSGKAKVDYDVLLPGRLSGVPRQIDTLVSESLGGKDVRTAYDAKFHSRPIDVKAVEEFLGLLRDVGVDRGVMVSKAGYTPAALSRAFADDVDLDLDVYTLDEFCGFQAAGALTYAEGHGVTVRAPLGWLVDGERNRMGVARLYRRGRTIEEAIKANEFAYIQFWIKRSTADTVDSLADRQEASLRKKDSNAIFSRNLIFQDQNRKVLIRKAEVAGYPCAEFTGFIEFKEFIFFVVMFTPIHTQRRNVRKLERLLLDAIPFNITVESVRK